MAENKDELTRWEYTAVPFHNEHQKEEDERFNEYGRNGWEAYGTEVSGSSSRKVLFKRPIIESRGRD